MECHGTHPKIQSHTVTRRFHHLGPHESQHWSEGCPEGSSESGTTFSGASYLALALQSSRFRMAVRTEWIIGNFVTSKDLRQQWMGATELFNLASSGFSWPPAVRLRLRGELQVQKLCPTAIFLPLFSIPTAEAS